MPTLFRDHSKPLDDAARATAPGRFLQLPDGRIHYRWDGPDNGPVVVMIHGFSLHHVAFDHIVPALAANGYRVLRMDNYGRGWSDRPSSLHDAALFERQLRGVLDALVPQQPVTLVGYSMGGAIAIHFAAHHPERIARLVLIAPAGLSFPRPALGRLVTVPLLGEVLIRRFGRSNTLRAMAALLAQHPALAAEYVDKFGKVIDFAGYYDGLLSTLRHYPLNTLEAEWRTVGANRVPTLMFWGDRDRTVPYPGEALLHRLMPAARIEVFPGEDHGIPMTMAVPLSESLLRFLHDTARAVPQRSDPQSPPCSL